MKIAKNSEEYSKTAAFTDGDEVGVDVGLRIWKKRATDLVRGKFRKVHSG